MGYWIIVTGDGNELMNGLPECDVDRVAQRCANELGDSVFASEFSLNSKTGEGVWGDDVEYAPKGAS